MIANAAVGSFPKLGSVWVQKGRDFLDSASLWLLDHLCVHAQSHGHVSVTEDRLRDACGNLGFVQPRGVRVAAMSLET